MKDEELRKKYDQFGEEGLKDNQSGFNYQSWNYYNQNFGIYDNDPEVITLSRSDFSNLKLKNLKTNLIKPKIKEIMF